MNNYTRKRRRPSRYEAWLIRLMANDLSRMSNRRIARMFLDLINEGPLVEEPPIIDVTIGMDSNALVGSLRSIGDHLKACNKADAGKPANRPCTLAELKAMPDGTRLFYETRCRAGTIYHAKKSNGEIVWYCYGSSGFYKIDNANFDGSSRRCWKTWPTAEELAVNPWPRLIRPYTLEESDALPDDAMCYVEWAKYPEWDGHYKRVGDVFELWDGVMPFMASINNIKTGIARFWPLKPTAQERDAVPWKK